MTVDSRASLQKEVGQKRFSKNVTIYMAHMGNGKT